MVEQSRLLVRLDREYSLWSGRPKQDIVMFIQLMRLDVYIRHNSFPEYAVVHIKIASPTCDWTYIYVIEKFKLCTIYEQYTLA